MIYYKDFDYKQLDSIRILKDSVHKTKRRNADTANQRRTQYFDTICAFDIETSLYDFGGEHPESIMYLWQFGIENIGAIYGRTWNEYQDFQRKLFDSLRSKKAILNIWVHNLAYEFQFLRGIYDFQPEDVFLLDRRLPLKAQTGRALYRCSYKQTNMGLAEFTKKMKVKHQKLSGDDFDYKKQRFPWTPLTATELQYGENDVMGLIESIRIEMNNDGDSLYSIPDTSTGYVRRDVKKATYYCREYIKSLAPDYELYKLLKDAFRGGNTHANPACTGKVLKNVHSYDMSSSYPSVLCNCLYPTSKFFHLKNLKPAYIFDLIYKHKKAIVMRIEFFNLRSRDVFPVCPYLSLSKCITSKERLIDNGRIVKAEYCQTAITDIDFKIIAQQYDWDNIKILDAYKSSYGKLPNGIKAQNIKYFSNKTTLKGIPEYEYFYMKDKNKLNSIYGMTAQDPGKDDCKYIDFDYEKQTSDFEKRAGKAVVPFQWGVWTTAHARYRLQDGINLVGKDFVYTDTDSVKFIGEHAAEFEALNEIRMQESIKSGAYAQDKKNKWHYMGVYEREEDYDLFITNGAKKYAYEINGKIGVTCAGVSTKPIPEKDMLPGDEKYKSIAAKELKQLKNYKAGFVFSLAGKNVTFYHDHPTEKRIIEGKEIIVTPNTAICDGTYTVGLSKEYQKYLQFLNSCIEKRDA